MKWSEQFEPNDEISYHHIKLNSPLGIVIIDWKGWKTNPSYDIHMDGKQIGVAYGLEEAKTKVKTMLIQKTFELQVFLKKEEEFKDVTIIPNWILKHIKNTFRLINNAYDSHKKETCLDRQVMQSIDFLKDINKYRE